MKGVLLFGGTGSRLYPLTKTVNKHLLPVGQKPMGQWGIEKLVSAGITEILIITGIEQCGSVISQFGDGSDYGCNLTYKVQVKAGGIAQALALAEHFVGGDSCCVILGDNIFNKDLTPIVKNFRSGATILLKEVKDPQRFGVAETTEKMSMYGDQVQVLNIEEKPKKPKSNKAVTGIYFYDNTVFDKIRTIKPSDRGELEITDVNNAYIAENNMTAYMMSEDEFWSDAGTFDSLHRANRLVRKMED